jgi:tetratricopeptide (TPR) repeat protein
LELASAWLGGDQPGKGRGQVEVLNELKTEIRNLIAAFDNALSEYFPTELQSLLGGLVIPLEIAGEYSLLLDCSQRAASDPHVAIHPELRVMALLALGHAELHLDHRVEALACTEKLLTLSEHVKSDIQSEIWQLHGSVCQRMGNFVAAGQAFERAAQEAEESSFSGRSAWLQSNRGLLALHAGELNAALQYLTDAASALQSRGDLRHEAVTRVNLTQALLRAGRLNEAEAQLRLAFDLKEALSDRRGMATCHLLRGACLLDRGDTEMARLAVQAAWSIYGELGLLYEKATALGNLGMIDYKDKDYQAAQIKLETALDYCRDLGNPRGQSAMLRFLAMVALAGEKSESARSYLQDGLSIALEANLERDVVILGALSGVLLAQLGRCGEAEELIRAAQAEQYHGRVQFEPDLCLLLTGALESMGMRDCKPESAQPGPFVEDWRLKASGLVAMLRADGL